MKTYYVEIVKDGKVLDIAATQGNNEEQAIAVITAAAQGRGWENFSCRQTTEEEYIKLKGVTAEKAADPKPDQHFKVEVVKDTGVVAVLDVHGQDEQHALNNAEAEAVSLGHNEFSVRILKPEVPAEPTNPAPAPQEQAGQPSTEGAPAPQEEGKAAA